jgi:integrase
MARQLHKLDAVTAKALKKQGRHSDGGGLYLKVRPDGRRGWVFLFRWHGRAREIGLGAFLPVHVEKGRRYDFVTLAKARTKAAAARAALAAGQDPSVTGKTDAIPTFGEFADAHVEAMKPAWRNEKHVAQWQMTLGDTYCKPLRPKPINEIDTADLLAVLQPIWKSKTETAARLRGRIEAVLDAAKAKGLRDGENPARWRGHLANLLPRRQKLTRGHHAALPYADLPRFIERLHEMEGMAACALEFLILTASRTGEVLGARWDEFDLKSAIWTVPATRMKAGREHRVPLSDRALAIVTALNENRVSDFVFSGRKRSRQLSAMSLAMTMRRMKLGQFTPHGMRSAFRDWAGEETHHPREIAEAALSHTVGDQVERAYRRGDALVKRRALMDDWACFLAGTDGNVVKLAARR